MRARGLGPLEFRCGRPGAHRLSGLWISKFRIKPDVHMVTAGSCFVQHIGKALTGSGYNWTDFEAAPPFLFHTEARKLGYGAISFRTGNI